VNGRAQKSFCFLKHFHPSKSEASYCNWLFARKQGGEIKDFQWQVAVPLNINGQYWRSWKVDFRVEENDGTFSYHESKGWNRSDDSFRLKRDAFLLNYPLVALYVNKARVYPGQRKAQRSSIRRRIKSLRFGKGNHG